MSWRTTREKRPCQGICVGLFLTCLRVLCVKMRGHFVLWNTYVMTIKGRPRTFEEGKSKWRLIFSVTLHYLVNIWLNSWCFIFLQPAEAFSMFVHSVAVLHSGSVEGPRYTLTNLTDWSAQTDWWVCSGTFPLLSVFVSALFWCLTLTWRTIWSYIANGIHVLAHKMSCNLCLSSQSLLITLCTNDGRSYTSHCLYIVLPAKVTLYWNGLLKDHSAHSLHSHVWMFVYFPLFLSFYLHKCFL